MSTQVTEAHLRLANQLVSSPPSPLVLATLIADSEARACDQFRAEVERLKHGTVAQFKDAFIEELKRENAELREWQAGVIANERLHHAERKDAIARAEKAEAELHALRLVCGTTDADRFSTWVDRANARAEKAEAELAAERAKVRMLHSALQNLADEQNGAPLERRREEWQEAMDEAIAALAATEEKL